jgi:hypothetical protein
MRFPRRGLAVLALLLLATPSFGADAPAAPDDPDAGFDDARAAAAKPLPSWRERRLEGGVALGASTESWSRSMFGYGPRFDVGIGVGQKFAVVIGESARFALGSDSLRMMSFGMQTGVAYGAPYQTRTGLGAAILVGAERLSTSTTIEAIVAWGATGSIGVRGSMAVGPVDVWVGLDGIARSESIRVGRPDPYGVGQLSAVVSVGCFFPALSPAVITASR